MGRVANLSCLEVLLDYVEKEQVQRADVDGGHSEGRKRSLQGAGDRYRAGRKGRGRQEVAWSLPHTQPRPCPVLPKFPAKIIKRNMCMQGFHAKSGRKRE